MKLSIALATYNGEAFLREQLTSLLNQTLLPHELIVCDDCSTDSTLEILEEFKANISFECQIYKNEINRGAAYSFKNAIDSCTGDIIIFCDQDDIWLPNKIEKIEKAFKETLNLDYVISNANIIDEESNYLGYSLWAQRKFSKYWINQFNSGYQFKVLQKNIITGMATAISKRVKELGNNKPLHVLHDAWYIYIASINDLNGKLIDIPLINYRQHENQQFGSTKHKNSVRISNLLKGNHKSVNINIKILEPLVEYAIQIFKGDMDNPKLIFLKDKLNHFKSRKIIIESKRVLRLNKIFLEVIRGRYFKFSSLKNILIDFI